MMMMLAHPEPVCCWAKVKTSVLEKKSCKASEQGIKTNEKQKKKSNKIPLSFRNEAFLSVVTFWLDQGNKTQTFESLGVLSPENPSIYGLFYFILTPPRIPLLYGGNNLCLFYRFFSLAYILRSGPRGALHWSLPFSRLSRVVRSRLDHPWRDASEILWQCAYSGLKSRNKRGPKQGGGLRFESAKKEEKMERLQANITATVKGYLTKR